MKKKYFAPEMEEVELDSPVVLEGDMIISCPTDLGEKPCDGEEVCGDDI